jgi:hypothetical protein
MNYRIKTLTIVLCLSLARLATGSPILQDENKPANGDTKHTEESKTKKAAPGSTIFLHIKIHAQGKEKLPVGSSIEVRGSQETCKKLERTQNIQSDEIMFPDIPVCKVQLRIFITDFNAQAVSVDLIEYKDPMVILVKSVGPPEVSYGVPAPKVESHENQPQELASHQ